MPTVRGRATLFQATARVSARAHNHRISPSAPLNCPACAPLVSRTESPTRMPTKIEADDAPAGAAAAKPNVAAPPADAGGGESGTPSRPAESHPGAGRSEDAYRVRVKPEYVPSERPACLARPADAPPRRDEGDDRGEGGTRGPPGGGNKRRNRGQNKKRPRDGKIASADKACLAVVRGQPCPYQNSPKGCKYNHDLKEMLANRPPDMFEGEGGARWLKGGCPFWEMNG